MMRFLPTGWVDPKDSYSNDSPLGSFLEVDFDYPDELHDFYNDYYPLAAEKI